jgi:hypothetical protein
MTKQTGLKLDEVILICPYCGKENEFAQGMITRTCRHCGKGYYRPMPGQKRDLSFLDEALNEGDGVYRP